jgi:hypothetical protein
MRIGIEISALMNPTPRARPVRSAPNQASER